MVLFFLSKSNPFHWASIWFLSRSKTPFRFRLTAKTALCWLLLPFPNRTRSAGLRFGCLRSSAAAGGVRLTDGVVFPFQIEPISLGFDLVPIKEQNTVPFPPHGENCTMLAPSSFSESNPLRWASIYFFYNKAGKHNLCLPAFAYSFGFPFLLFEKRYHNGAGARMGSDHTSYGRIANFFQFSLPDVTAVFDIL